MIPLDGAGMFGSYNRYVVVLSALIGVLASNTALDLAERVTAARGTQRSVWLISGAMAMEIGIWSMHYTAMLACRLPVPSLYQWPTVLPSLLAGMAASAVALFVVSRKRLGWLTALAGGIFQGAGIGAMHYILKAERAGEGFAIACSAIVQKHRGAIEFESGAGRGTAFRIRLPLQGTDGA